MYRYKVKFDDIFWVRSDDDSVSFVPENVLPNFAEVYVDFDEQKLSFEMEEAALRKLEEKYVGWVVKEYYPRTKRVE